MASEVARWRSLSSRNIHLMDLEMPVVDGWEATRRLKNNAETRDIPVIAFSAHALGGESARKLWPPGATSSTPSRSSSTGWSSRFRRILAAAARRLPPACRHCLKGITPFDSLCLLLFPLGGDYTLEGRDEHRHKGTARSGPWYQMYCRTGFPTPAPPTPTTPQMNVPHRIGSGTQRSLSPRSCEQSARHR